MAIKRERCIERNGFIQITIQFPSNSHFHSIHPSLVRCPQFHQVPGDAPGGGGNLDITPAYFIPSCHRSQQTIQKRSLKKSTEDIVLFYTLSLSLSLSLCLSLLFYFFLMIFVFHREMFLQFYHSDGLSTEGLSISASAVLRYHIIILYKQTVTEYGFEWQNNVWKKTKKCPTQSHVVHSVHLNFLVSAGLAIHMSQR